MWRAAANMVPLAAANRVSVEGIVSFYGPSFIAGLQGKILTQAPCSGDAIIRATFDLDALRARRAACSAPAGPICMTRSALEHDAFRVT